MTLILESTPTERAALLTYWLANGQQLTTADVAENMQISQRTAQRLFTAVSRVGIPIFRDENGIYRLLEDEPLEISPY